MQSEQA
jgi:hypothetical protein